MNKNIYIVLNFQIQKQTKMHLFLLLGLSFSTTIICHDTDITPTLSIDELADFYEDDKNAMIAEPDFKDKTDLYDEFYDEFENSLILELSMNMIFFGPASSFLRIDPESLLHILTYTKKHLIPTNKVLLAWDIITDGKTAAFLQGREYLAFGSLLNYVPEEDLYYVNFGDASVVKYFSNYYDGLKPRKYGILAASYKRYFGDNWYENSSNINELGYLICGFPASDLAKISPLTFRDLSKGTLNKAGKCDCQQTITLYNIAIHHDAYGEPYKWSSHEVNKLSKIFIYISNIDISSISLEAVAAITPEVMHALSQDKLEYFTKQQILRMNPLTRRIYIIRMQLKSSFDMSEISRQQGMTNDTPRNRILIEDLRNKTTNIFYFMVTLVVYSFNIT